MSPAKFIRTPSRAIVPAPDALRQRLAHPEWFHIQEQGGATNMTVNVLRMPPPERSLVASLTAVEVEDRSVSMIFGQQLPGAQQMHGALCVQMNIGAVVQLIRGSEEFLSELARFGERHGIVPARRTTVGLKYPAERVVMERASIASISFSEDETEIRFYRVSATDMRLITTEKAAKAELVHPVVEVLLGTSELVHLMHSLNAAVSAASQTKEAT